MMQIVCEMSGLLAERVTFGKERRVTDGCSCKKGLKERVRREACESVEAGTRYFFASASVWDKGGMPGVIVNTQVLSPLTKLNLF